MLAAVTIDTWRPQTADEALPAGATQRQLDERQHRVDGGAGNRDDHASFVIRQTKDHRTSPGVEYVDH